MEGEHCVIADLMNLALGSSSPSKNLEIKAVGRELVISTQPGQPYLAREDFGHVPQVSKRENRGSHLECLPFTKKGSRSAPKHLRREGGCLNG